MGSRSLIESSTGILKHKHSNELKVWGLSRGYAKRTIDQFGSLYGSFQNLDTKKTYNITSRKNDLNEEDVGTIMTFIKQNNQSVMSIVKSNTNHKFSYSTDKEVITLDVKFGPRSAKVVKYAEPLILQKSNKSSLLSWFKSLVS